MKQAKKGNQWNVDMKAYIGGDAGTGLIHNVAVTWANIDVPPHYLTEPSEEADLVRSG